MGHDLAGIWPGQGPGSPPRDPLPALDRATLFRVHLLHRLQSELRGVQGDGAGPLRGAQVREAHLRAPPRSQARRQLPAESRLFRLLHGLDDDQRQVRRAVRRPAPQARGVAHPAGDGLRRLDPGGHRGGGTAPHPVTCQGDRQTKPLPRRRGGPQLRGQRQSAAGRALQGSVDPARRGGRRRGAGCRTHRLPPLQGPAEEAERQIGPHVRRLPGPRLRPGRVRAPAPGSRGEVLSPFGGRGHRRLRPGACRRQGAGLVPGAHGVWPTSAWRALDPGRCTLAKNAILAQPQGQVSRVLPPLRALGAPGAGSGLLRDRLRQPLHAARGRRRQGSQEDHDRRGAGALRHREAQRPSIGHTRGNPRRLLGAHPDRSQGNEPALSRADHRVRAPDRLRGDRQHELQRARRADRLHSRRRLPLLHGHRDRGARGRAIACSGKRTRTPPSSKTTSRRSSWIERRTPSLEARHSTSAGSCRAYWMRCSRA